MSSDEQSANDEVEQISNQEHQQSTNQQNEQSTNQHHEEPANQQIANLSHNLRNDLELQNRQIDGDLMSFGGNVNVEDSDVSNFQNFGHVENLTVNITRTIVGPQQNIEVTNSRIDNNGTTSNSPAADAEAFDEQRFRNYFVRMECRYKDISLEERPITEAMYDNTPIAVETSLQQLSNRSREQITQEGTTKLSQAFPIEGEGTTTNRIVAIIGEPGAGKSVYSITLKSYYIKQWFFVFSLNFLTMNFAKESMSFAELLIDFACPDFPFDSPKTFAIWLFHNEDKCVFILDGLDHAPHMIKPNVDARNIESVASVGIWMSALLSRKIMTKAKVIYTSRPTSVVNLPISQQPDQIFSLNGFSDQSIEGVIKTYNNEHADQITQFIKNKGPDVIRFTRTPFVISLCSLVYGSSFITHISPETTITEIYGIGLHQLSSSIRRLIDEDGDPNKNQQTEDLVDRFYYEVFLENKTSFTGEDVIKRKLVVRDLEQFSLISITSSKFSLGVESKERRITPQHQTVSEYHVSRHLVKVMDIEDFKTVVEKQMFNLYDQDRWNMIRKFVAGLINTGKFDERKRIIFLSKFVTVLKYYVTGDLFNKCTGTLENASLGVFLQSSLFNDIPELSNEMDFIRAPFTGVANLAFYMTIKDASSLYGPIYFLRHIDPHLQQLDIRFSEDITILQFNQLAEAIKNLSQNVGKIAIRNIQLTHESMEHFHGIIKKTEDQLEFEYNPQVNLAEIEMIKQNLQSQIDHFQSKKTYNVLTHQHRRKYLIGHSMHTTMTSSIVIHHLMVEQHSI